LLQIDQAAPEIEFIKLLKNVNETFASYTEYSKVVPLSMISGSINWKYVSYHGSVTVPPCREVVTWLVPVQKIIKLSKQNMEVFRGNKLSDDYNFRLPQPLNGREFYCSTSQQREFR
jgi:carbonic anhydrase